MVYRAGDWVWIDAHTNWIHCQVTLSEYDAKDDCYYLELVGHDGEEWNWDFVRINDRHVVKDERKSEAVRAAMHNSRMEEAGQLSLPFPDQDWGSFKSIVEFA